MRDCRMGDVEHVSNLFDRKRTLLNERLDDSPSRR